MNWRRWLAVVLVVAAIAFLLERMLPTTSPTAIHLKTRVIGPRLTYAPLAHDDALWQVILDGVRSGEPRWLRVAADLRPALDTHPGEEMLAAVTTVFETNPVGAIKILLPAYGADEVCGRDEDYAVLAPVRAEQRLALLGSLKANPEDDPEYRECVTLLETLRGQRDALQDSFGETDEGAG